MLPRGVVAWHWPDSAGENTVGASALELYDEAPRYFLTDPIERGADVATLTR